MVDVERFSPETRNVPERRPAAPTGKLDDSIVRLITIEVNIQKRVAELLIKMNELMTRVDKMVSLLEKAGDVEETDLQKVVQQLKIIVEQNEDILGEKKPKVVHKVHSRSHKKSKSKRFSDL